jgi:hypothetical protein
MGWLSFELLCCAWRRWLGAASALFANADNACCRAW